MATKKGEILVVDDNGGICCHRPILWTHDSTFT